MAGLIGKKVGMTSLFETDGRNTPCTVLEVGPCVVTQVRTKEKDGYDAYQLSFGDKKEKNTSKAMIGHFAKASSTPKRKLKEFKNFEGELTLGQVLSTDLFVEGDMVSVVGTSKGKGFQGVVKRHGFSGVGGQTHGQHNRLRAPGSLGASSFPSRVFKGMRMAGRTGGDAVKVKGLQVLKVVAEHNLIVVKGAVPGAKGSYVTIEK